eukprot:m.192523 g.192523  ORF g.192523 m.192523 type:complete len:360 (-) comp17586_c2_seq11:2939-4018(-)
MDILKAEIERKRNDLQSTGVVKEVGARKFFKRGELKQLEDQKYLEQKRKEEEERQKLRAQSVSKQPQHEPAKHNDAQDDLDGPILPADEIFRRLRERGLPIILFGETIADTQKRLRLEEIRAPEVFLERQRNDFRDAMHDVDEEFMNEILQHQGEQDTSLNLPRRSQASQVQDLSSYVESLGDGFGEKDQHICRKVLKTLLKLWEEDLDARDVNVKMTAEGRNASATLRQTDAYMQPLLKQLKKNEVSDAIMGCLAELVREMVRREYIKASDAYYRMAIGNAPWPIGVTNVGIHSRTGREKIFAQHIAHALNDEVQRKYIQGLKRIMSYCQKRFPTDPSKCLEYQAVGDALYGVAPSTS